MFSLTRNSKYGLSNLMLDLKLSGHFTAGELDGLRLFCVTFICARFLHSLYFSSRSGRGGRDKVHRFEFGARRSHCHSDGLFVSPIEFVP